ncbi:hypothetical protein F5B17DRAFT_417607 [Nemania serpens]|nr:hypothetical protein F5B17DRAFT_417607 [Nemania serpens]
MAISDSTTKFTTPGLLVVVDTPTHTISSDASLSCVTPPAYAITHPTNDNIESVPAPHKAYMIRNRDTGGAITMEEGLLTLKPPAGTRGGWHWHCVERAGGWLGFREAVLGKYLGRDDKGGFQAKFKHFIEWESFCLRPLEEGGYHMLVLRVVDNSPCLRRVGVSDGGKLVEVKDAAEAARWDFVQV